MNRLLATAALALVATSAFADGVKSRANFEEAYRTTMLAASGTVPVKDCDNNGCSEIWTNFNDEGNFWAWAGTLVPGVRFVCQNKGSVLNVRECITSEGMATIEQMRNGAWAIQSETSLHWDSAANAEESAAKALAETKVKKAADDAVKAQVEADRPRLEAEAKAKVEAEQAQIIADAKAKVRAQIEADLRAKKIADATAKAEADAKDEIEKASKAKDEASATAKANEDARLEAEAVARQDEQVRADKAEADAKVRAAARAKEEAIAQQAEAARQAREADEQASATKAKQEAAIAAQLKKAQEDNIKKTRSDAENAVMAKKAEWADAKAQWANVDDNLLARNCAYLYPWVHTPEVYKTYHIGLMYTVSCALLQERGRTNMIRPEIRDYLATSTRPEIRDYLANTAPGPESDNEEAPARAPVALAPRRSAPVVTAEVPPARRDPADDLVEHISRDRDEAIAKAESDANTFVASCSFGKKGIALTINPKTNDASVAVNDGTVVAGMHTQATDENGVIVGGHYIYENNTPTVWYVAPQANPQLHSAVKLQGKWFPLQCGGFQPMAG